MNGERWLGNQHKHEVHDLDNEQTRCQIDEIVAAGHDRPYVTREIAVAAGFDNCAWCIGNSKR